MTLKKILIPIDFSEASYTAINYARGLITSEPSHIILMYVHHISLLHKPLEDLEKRTGEEFIESQATAIQQLEEIIAELKTLPSAGSYPEYRYQISEGSITEELSKYAASEKIDLVIVGHNQDGELRQLLLGNIAFKLLEHLSCPVIIVPEGASYQEIHSILFISTTIEKEQNVLDTLSSLQEFHHADIHTVVLDIPEKILEDKLVTGIEHEGGEGRHHAHSDFVPRGHGSILHKIKLWKEELDMQLIVMTVSHDNLPANIVSRNVLHHIAAHVNIPVLVFK